MANPNRLKKGALEVANEKLLQEFSYDQLKKFTTNFRISLGSDGFGDVYKGLLNDGTNVAVKVLKERTDVNMEKQFEAEFRTMGRASHKNLIKLIGYCIDANKIALIYELMEKGPLSTILHPNHLSIEWLKLYSIAIGIAMGLSYLHEYCDPNIIHYDIKPDNVLLDSNYTPKIADFGVAKILHIDLSGTGATQFCCRGTRGYAAPEVGNGDAATSKSDVYSFGKMMFKLLGREKNVEGVEIWKNYEKGELMKFILESGFREEEKEKAYTLAVVALLCCQYFPEHRPRMSIVVNMLQGEFVPLPKPLNLFPWEEHSITASRLLEKNFPSGREGPNYEKPSPSPSRRPPPVDTETRSETLLGALSPRLPPGGENSVIMYTTLEGHKERKEDSDELRKLLLSKKIVMEERSIDSEPYLDQLKTLMGEVAEMEVPLVFIKGRLVGGIDEVRRKIQEREFDFLFYGFVEEERPSAKAT